MQQQDHGARESLGSSPHAAARLAAVPHPPPPRLPRGGARVRGPQAAAHGAEIVVVEDDPADPETERLVTAHGGRYLAHGAPRGINVARNSAIDAASGELLCFLDDDVRRGPAGWRRCSPPPREHPGHEAFGGPIRPRLEGALPSAACARDRRRDARCATCAPSPARYPRDAAMAEAEAFLDGRAVRHARAGGRDARGAPGALMRVAIVAEYYPRAADPVLGVWAHRQALAARDAGADVRVLVLHRPVPSRAALRARDPRGARRPAAPAAAHRARRARGPLRAVRRPAAAAQLRLAGARGRRRRWRSRCGGCGASSPTTSCTPTTPRPAGDAVRRARAGRPVRRLRPRRRRALRRRAGRAASGRCAARSAARGSCSPTRPRSSGAPARSAPARTRVVHLGTDLPAGARRRDGAAALVTVAHLVARKRHADVLRALWLLRDSHPSAALDRRRRRARAPGARAARARSSGSPAACASRGALAARRGGRGRAARRACSCSRASTRRSASPTSRRWRAACPAIGCRGEPGPEEIAAARRRHPARRARRPRGARGRAARAARRAGLAARARRAARATVEAAFTWPRCGRGDRRRLRGGAAVSATRGRSCSSPTTRRRSASAPSRALHEREDVVFALIGGEVRHGGGARPATAELPFPVLRPSQRGVARLAASGRYRAVVAGLSGRVALPAAYARRAPRAACRSCCGRRSGRTRAPPAHALSYLPLRALYRDADAIATYGPHVSRLRARQGRARAGGRGAAERRRRVLGARPPSRERRAPFQALFAGRLAREKGVCVLLQAWRAAGLSAPATALVLVGDGPLRARAVAAGAARLEGPLPPRAAAQLLRRAATLWWCRRSPRATSCEPWGLVVNEAFDQGVPVIATDAVGAAAGGLVQHERTGLVVPAGRRRARWRPRCGACTTTRRCARGSAPTRREAVARALPRRLGGGHERGAAGRGSVRMRPASVFRMLRLALACLVLGLLVAVPAASAASTTQILRDCADDGVLQGNYTPSELRKARQNIPTDTDEYTDCRDVLRAPRRPARRVRRRRRRGRRRAAPAAAAAAAPRRPRTRTRPRARDDRRRAPAAKRGRRARCTSAAAPSSPARAGLTRGRRPQRRSRRR